jgi:uncharacterized protein (UPF0332 family)
VSSGVLDKEYSKILMGAEKLRNKSDYDDFYIVSRSDAEKQIANAKTFISAIESLISDRNG